MVDDTVEWKFDETNEEEGKISLVVMGKVWAQKNVNANAVMETMQKIWQPNHGMEARRLADNLFSFQLFHWRDKARIMEG